MKTAFFTAVMTLVSTVASAQSVASLFDTQTIRSLPSVRVIGVEVQNGPQMAAVQPMAFLKFEFASCATQSFSAKTEERNGILFVAVDLPELAADCMGMPVKREYTVQISSDFRHRVVVLNPTEQKAKN